jgi:ribosomal protein S27AE
MSIDQSASRTVSEIEQHNRWVRRRGADRKRYRKFCARCDAQDAFSPHDLRRRGLRVVSNHTVLLLTVWLARWRCKRCRYVFTDYPDFRTSL